MSEYAQVGAEWHTFSLSGVTLAGDLPHFLTLFTESAEDDAVEIGIRTGVAMGPVLVAVEVREREPDAHVDDWEDVAETSVQVVGPVTVYGIWDEEVTHTFHVPPGDYRLRVSATGHELEYDAAAVEPVERYLLQLWPAAPSSTVVFRATTPDLTD